MKITLLNLTNASQKALSILAFISILFIGNYSSAQGDTLMPAPADPGDAATTGTWTVPCGVTEVTIWVWGGGGAGGDASGGIASGGGGGGFSTMTLTVTPGQSFPYSVGSGAPTAGGASNGEDGNPSSVTVPTGTLLANGGGGGDLDGVGSAGGVGGTASGPAGSTNTTGGVGQDAETIPNFSGDGGAAPMGGSGAPGFSASGLGAGGFGPGGGGSGAVHTGGGSNAGGVGGSGGVLFSWTVVTAGAGGNLTSCITSLALTADPAPAGTTGTWTYSPADGSTFTGGVNDPNATFEAATIGENYTLAWTISGGVAGCTPSYDYITVNTSGSEANAGYDQNLCASSYSLDANTVEVGFTGTWSVVSQPAGPPSISFDDPTTDPDGTITSAMVAGECAVLAWTVTGLCTTVDYVTICFAETCNDDPCGALDAAYVVPIDGACVTQTVVNADVTESLNPGRPGCGQFHFFDDAFDVWFSAGPVGADGALDIDVTGASGDYSSMAIYETSGSCNELTSLGCYQNNTSGGTASVNQTGLTPGATVYIRVWDYFDQTPTDISVCVTSTTNTSDIIDGDNTITCGSSSTFYDSGGNAGGFASNYSNNEVNTYTICPDTPGQVVSVAFTSMAMATSLDHIIVLNGSEGTSQVIGDITGTTTPTYTSTHSDGCLTFIFQSNAVNTAAGWEANVTCVTPSAGDDANHLTSTCGEQNCLGGCLRTLCGIPSNVAFQGDGFANQELNESTNGCWTAAERCSNWFYINPLTAGDLSLNLFVNSGQDQDFLIWEGFGDELQCPAETGDAPISCNYAGATGQGTGFNDDLTGTNPAYEPSLIITEDDIANDIYFMVNIQTYSNGAACPQPNVNVTFGGSVDLGCGAPIPLSVNLINFTGVAKERTNALYWSTATETNNDYFTIQSSRDFNSWSDVAVVDGAGTTSEKSDYELNDDMFSSRITYYRVMATDFDGVNTYSQAIALARDIEINTIISNIFPNPANDEMHFVARGGNSDLPIIMNVYNSLGQKMIAKEYTDYSGSVALSFNVSQLPVGIYNVEVINGDMLEMQKISVIK